jgi:FkbM family methyltransferase
MNLLAYLKLIIRARKYRYRNDPGEIAYLFSKIKKDDKVFDIGAHKGAYLFYMSKLVGKSGKVYVFEPQSILYKYLLTIKGLFSSEIIIENLALSDSSKEQVLNIPSHKNENKSSPGASLSNNFVGQKIIKTEKIQSISLDEYCKHSNIRPDFLKIDVEGHELEVLKGAEEILKSYKPGLLVEIEERHIGLEKLNETINFLLSLGYNGYFFKGKDKLPISEFNPALHQNPTSKPYCNNFVFER